MNPPSSTSPSVASTTVAARARPSLFRRVILHAFAGMTRGQLRVTLPDGTACEFGAPDGAQASPDARTPGALLRIRREAFFAKCFWSGDIGFAESFIDGDWNSPDLTAVVAWFILNLEQAPTLSGSRHGRSAALNLLRIANRLGHLLRPNTRTIARRNIHQHYDLSNDFFSLLLDPTMMYSSALWPATHPDLSLADAQREKNEALCRSLRLTADDHVLEIGSGWGGWAVHAAQNHGCRVTTITLSLQQHDFTRSRIAAAGLTGRVEVQLRDYRDLTGRFDKIVSIEMMEAIGHRYLPEFAAVIARVLKDDGLLALQFITCPDARYQQIRRGVDFIQKHIFPGSLLLSLNRVNELLTRAGGFVLHGAHDFGPDYARTLHLWHENFRDRLEDVRALGFDDRFIRKWNYYFCYCEAAFAMRNLSVVHTLHTRPNNLSLK